MANQYNGSFTSVVESKYKRPLKEVLQSLSDNGMTSKSIADLLGFTVGTVKRYANKLGVDIASNSVKKDKHHYFWDDFRKGEINQLNVLFRGWLKLI